MTEEEWFTVIAPDRMLDWVAKRCPARKLRLYAVACCRRLAHRYGKPFADALAEAEELADRPVGRKVLAPRRTRRRGARDEWDLLAALNETRPIRAAQYASQRAVASRNGNPLEERWFHALYLCDLIGNPFRPIAFAAAWRTETVQLLAKQMYETRDFSAMPILADALQEAGCDSADMLGHCRDMSQAHVRGCWVVDLVLGKG